MVAALVLTPAGKTVVNIAEVTGQGTPTLTVSGTYSCAAGARRLVVTVNNADASITHDRQVVQEISCPAVDVPYRVELAAPVSVWWHRKLNVYADLRDPDTVQAATYAALDQGTLLAVTADTAELKGGNLVVSGTVTTGTARITVEATQGDVHGATTAGTADRYAVPVHPANAKVFQAGKPIDFTVTAQLPGHRVAPGLSGTLQPSPRNLGDGQAPWSRE